MQIFSTSLSFNFSCRLTTLNLAWVGFAPTCLRQVVLHLPPSLVHLNLSGNRNTLVDEDLQLLADKCPLLEVLDVSDSHLLTVESVGLLCKGFPQMTHLRLVLFSAINDNTPVRNQHCGICSSSCLFGVSIIPWCKRLFCPTVSYASLLYKPCW